MGVLTMRVDGVHREWAVVGVDVLAMAEAVVLCAEPLDLRLELADSLGERGKLGGLLWGDGEHMLQLCDCLLELDRRGSVHMRLGG